MEALFEKLKEAEHKAWLNLARRKYMNFGYWCAIWVHLAKLYVSMGGKRPASPFREAVNLAESKLVEKCLKVP